MKAHVIGLCGKGMSAIALLLKQKGYEVTGSDSGVFEPIATTLKNNGVELIVGYKAENIPDDVDRIILGSSAQLSAETNKEVARAESMDLNIQSFAEVLSDLTDQTNNIVVTGSYGKSTCTSLATHILLESKKDPSYFIGAEPKNFGTAHLGSGPDFVLEGDEYPHDRTSVDAKFLFYNPNTILLTSAAHDHINKFPTIEDYLKPYKKLIEILPDDAVVVAGINHPNVPGLVTAAKQRIVSYGLTSADYYPENIIRGPVTSFSVMKNGQKITELSTTMLGDHNIENIVGVSALLLENDLVTVDELTKAVASFAGVKKRLELKNPGEKIPMYESFGSSYDKALADIAAIHDFLPGRKIIAVFEPHTFGWRNRGNLSWYDTVFNKVEKVIVFKPPTAGSATHDQLNLNEIVNRIGEKAIPESKKIQISSQIKSLIQDDSIILLITSSNFDGELLQIIKDFSLEKPL